jgi:hypothetical protein
MARGIRVEYPGAFYHLMARGNRRERIFRDDGDRRVFCETLGETCERTGWRVTHDQREAERLLQEGLAAADLDESALSSLPGSDARKAALASLLLDRTVARQSWIAERLAMRSAANVSQQVRRHRIKNPKLPAKLKAYLQSVKIC